MKTNQLLKNSLLLAAGLFLSAAAANAAVYHVSIDTSTLAVTGNGPFSLAFQFNGGDTPSNNTVLVSSFSFGGGSASGDGVLTGGVTAGSSLFTTVELSDSTAFSEFYQQFTAGSRLEFDLDMTQNLDGVTPDSFSVAILDGSLVNIDTTSPFGSLVQFDIDSAGILTVNTSSGTGVYSGVTAAVPEPSSLLIGLLAGGLGLRRRRSQ